jgi:hypothetical protein
MLRALALLRAAQLLLLLLPRAAPLDLVAASTIQACTATSAAAINCSSILLVAAAIQNAETFGTGSLQYSVAAAAGAAGFANGAALPLLPADTVTLTITQSAIRYQCASACERSPAAPLPPLNARAPPRAARAPSPQTP